jgi:hypothetical protein
MNIMLDAFWAQPGAASYHLPKLRLRAHQLEKDKVQHLWNVNACVEHVHGNRDMGRFRQIGKIIN